jgi:hypothetical protein
VINLEHDFLDAPPKHKTLWRLWAKALGEKAGSTDQEADTITLFRTIIAAVNFITCIFIIMGILHHW